MNTVEIKTTELTGLALDWAVAEATDTRCAIQFCGKTIHKTPVYDVVLASALEDRGQYVEFHPSKNWFKGGELIERFRVSVKPQTPHHATDPVTWLARTAPNENYSGGETPLTAVCRAIVQRFIGDRVKVPSELAQEVSA